MAKNYTFSEAVELIAKGDMEAIQDIGRRFPMLATKIAAVSALAGESFVDLASYMPDYLTANKVNRGMRDALAEMEENEDVEETKTTKSEVKTKVEETEDEEEEVDYNKMTAKELWDILGEAGKRNTAKSKKKADLVAAVEAMAGTEEAEEEDEADEEEADNPYEGRSAMDLFKECKKRGIKAAAKKPAKFYADLLLKADAEDEEEEEDDDWDVEEVEEKSKKKAPVKKAKEEVEEDDEDEDDDWDI